MSEQPIRYAFGWKKSPHDPRDYKYALIKPRVALPRKFSRRAELDKPNDQGRVGACVAFAVSVLMAWFVWKEIGSFVARSQRFIYALRPNNPEEGMFPRDAMDIVLKKGDAPESMCPGDWYVNTGIDDVPCNDQKTLDAAYENRIKSYAAVLTVEDIKQAVYQDGIVVIGIPVTNAWVTGAATINGHIPYQPGAGIIGYHMIAVIGWDDDAAELEFRNSWYNVPVTTPWGDHGNGWLPFAYWDGYSASGDTEGYSAVDMGPQPANPTLVVNTIVQGSNITPIPSVNVAVDGHSGVTDSNGSVSLKMEFGNYTTQCNKTGYNDATLPVQFTVDEQIVTVGMTVNPNPPSPWERFVACVKQAWKNQDIIAMIGCLQELWTGSEWLPAYKIKVSTRKNGTVVITIKKGS